MSGEVSENAKMTLKGDTDDGGDGVGMNDGVPPAADARQVPDGQPKEYPTAAKADPAENEKAAPENDKA